MTTKQMAKELNRMRSEMLKSVATILFGVRFADYIHSTDDAKRIVAEAGLPESLYVEVWKGQGLARHLESSDYQILEMVEQRR